MKNEKDLAHQLLAEAGSMMYKELGVSEDDESSLNESSAEWVVLGIYAAYLVIIFGTMALCTHLNRKVSARNSVAINREEFKAAMDYLKGDWFDSAKNKVKTKFAKYCEAGGIEFVHDILANASKTTENKKIRNDGLIYRIPIAHLDFKKIVSTLASKDQAKFNSSIANAKAECERIANDITTVFIDVFETAKSKHEILKNNFAIFMDIHGTTGYIYIASQLGTSLVFDDSKYLKK